MATLFNTRIFETYQGLIKTIDNAAISATLKELTDGSGNQSGLYINTAGDFKVTNVLEWGSLKDTGTGVIVTRYVTSTDGIENFDNNTSLPTTAAVKLYVDTKFATSDTLQEVLSFGNTTSGNDIAVSASDDITLTTTSKIIMGTSGAAGNFQIYNDGSNSYISENGAGDLRISTNAAQVAIQNSLSENMGRFIVNNAVILYYDNIQKFQTTNTGISVVGVISNVTDPTAAQDAATKSYVDGLDAGSDLDITDGTTAGAVNLNTQSLSILGTTNEIDSVVSGQSVTIGLPSSISTNLVGNVTGNLTGTVLTATQNSIETMTGLTAVGTNGVNTTFSSPIVASEGVTGNVTGDLTGNVTATSVLANGVTATTQASSDDSTKVATTAYVKGLDNASDLDFSGDSGTGDVNLNTQTFAVTGTANQIQSTASNQGLSLQFPTAGVTLPDGSVATTQSALDNSTKVATTSYVDTSAALYLPLVGGIMSGNTIHNNSVKSIYGTSSDAEIYHDGSDFYAKNTTGNLYIDQAAVTESIFFRVSDANALDVTALTISRSGDLTTGRNVTIAGDLTVNGTTTTVNSQTLSVVDPLIQLAKANTANSLDIGYYGDYNDGTGRFLGMFSDASDGNKFKLFKGTTVEPTTTVNLAGAGYVAADLQVAGFEATTGTFTGITSTNELLWGNAFANGKLSWDTGYALIQGQAGNGIKFQPNSGTALTLDTSGNATFEGNIIGKNSFWIENAANARWQQLFDGNNWNIRYYNGSSWSADALAIDTSNNSTFAGSVSITQNSGSLEFSNTGSGHGSITTGLSKDLNIGAASGNVYINNNTTFAGNVGIGRSPVAYGSFKVLDLAGSSGAIQKLIHTGNSVELQAFASSSVGAIGTATSHSLLITTADVTAITIDTSQNSTFAGDIQLTGSLYKNTGDLIIKGSTVRVKGIATNENLATFIENGAVQLFYDNVEKFATTSTGISVSGTSSTFAGSVGVGAAPLQAKLDILDVGAYSAHTGHGLAINSNASNAYTSMYMGADDTVDAAYIQSAARNTSFTSKKLLLNPNGGNVGVGTATPNAPFQIASTNKTINGSLSGSNLSVYTTDTQATDVGASIGLGGMSTTPAGFEFYGTMAGRKENSTNLDSSGYLAFYTQRVAVGHIERMRLDSLGNLGIGSNDPQVPLQIGTHITTAPADTGLTVSNRKSIRINDADGSYNFGVYIKQNYSGSSYLILGTRHNAIDTDALFVKSGNVGIGETSPSTKTEIKETNNDIYQLTIFNSHVSTTAKTRIGNWANEVKISSNLMQSGGTKTQDDATKASWVLGLGGGGDGFNIQRSPAGSTTLTDYLAIDSLGNVGITAAAYLGFNGAADSSHSIGYDSVIDGVQVRGQNGIRFGTGSGTGTERMRIDSSGRLGLGVTPLTWSTGVGKVVNVMQLNGNGALFTRADNTFLSQNFYYNSADAGAVIDAGQGSIIQCSAGEIIFSGTSTGASSGSTVSVIERMRITSDGSLARNSKKVWNFTAVKTFNEGGSSDDFFRLNFNGNTVVVANITLMSNNSSTGSRTMQSVQAMLSFSYQGYLPTMTEISKTPVSNNGSSYISAVQGANGSLTFLCDTTNNGTGTGNTTFVSVELVSNGSINASITVL